MSRPMRPSDCAETTQEAAHARALDATQAGALQAVELCDEQVREGFRAYDWQIRGARHQTPWQLWRDGAFWAIRAVNSGALAASQPNAAPAAAIEAREQEVLSAIADEFREAIPTRDGAVLAAMIEEGVTVLGSHIRYALASRSESPASRPNAADQTAVKNNC